MSAAGDERPVRFQLVVPPELSDQLVALPNLTATVQPPSDRQQAELALETVVTILSIAVAAQELKPTLKFIATKVHEYFARSPETPAAVEVIGRRDQRVIRIRLDEPVASAASEIEIVVTR